MVDVEIENIEQQYDEESEEVASYVVEYSIPQYGNTYRTEPIPAEDFDQELAKERVAEEAEPLVATPNINVQFPSETTSDDPDSSRRRSIVLAGGAVLGLGVLGGAGYAANLFGSSDPGTQSLGTPQNTSGMSTERNPTETPSPTQSPTPTPNPSNSQPSGEALSFEDGTIGSESVPDPWYVMETSGTVSITDNASNGSKAINLTSTDDLKPIAVGVDIDLTDVSQILADMYPVAVSPSYGYVKFLLDKADRSNGHIHCRDHPGRTAHGGGHTEAFRDEEWHTGIEFYLNTGTNTELQNISGEHTLILHTSGDNDVIWDNIRFEDDSGEILSLEDVLV